MITRRLLMSAAGAAGLAALPAFRRPAQAQAVRGATRLIVGFPPGGPVDLVARLLIQAMKDYAPTIVVESRPGAGGRLALEALKTSAADGSVFLITPASMIVLHPHVHRTLGYDPARDFAPVTTICDFPLVVAIGPRVPPEVRTLEAFIDWCRANPRQATYGSPSAGSAPHFTGVTLARAAGIELLHVPYNGTLPAMQDLLGGQIAANITVLPAALPHVGADGIRVVATTGPRRNAWLPDVPTLKEAGYFALESVDWLGIFVPARTPADVVDRLNRSVRAALTTSNVKAGLSNLSFDIAGSTSAEFARLIKSDTERWASIVRASGFRPED